MENNCRKGILIALALGLLIGGAIGFLGGWNAANETPIGQCSFRKDIGLYQVDPGYYIRPSGERVWIYGGVAGTMTESVNLSVNIKCKLPENVLENTEQIPAGEVIADEQGNGHIVYMVYMAQKLLESPEVVIDPLP
jgi:hypothetical protein